MQPDIEQWVKVEKMVGHPDKQQTTILTRHITRDEFTIEVRRDGMNVAGPRKVSPEAAEKCVLEYHFKPVDTQQPARKNSAKVRHVS